MVRSLRFWERELARASGWALRELRKEGIRVPSLRPEVAFVPAAHMRRLKRRFLKEHAGTPEVLSFPEPKTFARLPKEAPRNLGEIYLNDTVRTNGPDRAVYLLFHGILHLLGFSHARARDTIAMEKMEKKLLSRFNPARVRRKRAGYSRMRNTKR